MKKALPVIFGCILFTACSKKNYPAGTYQDAVVTVDGDLGEWTRPLRFGTSGGQVQYNITNDSKDIYVSLETHDEATAIKMLSAGVNIYIDPIGGQRKKMCLAFPLKNTSSPALANKRNAASMKPDRNEFREALLIQAVNFSATGFKNMENRVYDVSDKNNIQVAIKSDGPDGLAYEAAIPLKDIFGEGAGAGYAALNVSVGVFINAMKDPRENSMHADNTSGHSSGMHGGGRGGGGGNYHRSPSAGSEKPGYQAADRASLFKQDANWYSFKLAHEK